MRSLENWCIMSRNSICFSSGTGSSLAPGSSLGAGESCAARAWASLTSSPSSTLTSFSAVSRRVAICLGLACLVMAFWAATAIMKAATMTVTARVPRFLGPVIGHVRKKLSLKQMQNGTVVIGGGYEGRVDMEAGESDVLYAGLPGNMKPVVDAFPHLARVPIVRNWTGLEGNTPDAIPYIGPSPNDPTLVHSFGYSGHGFQLGPICGVIVADLVMHGATPLPIGAFQPDRFATAGTLQWGAKEGTAVEEQKAV